MVEPALAAPHAQHHETRIATTMTARRRATPTRHQVVLQRIARPMRSATA
jgi:hypothetical protein